MSRISEIERPGLPLRIAYRIGERMFGVVPTPEKVMAHRPALMVALGGLHTAPADRTSTWRAWRWPTWSSRTIRRA